MQTNKNKKEDKISKHKKQDYKLNYVYVYFIYMHQNLTYFIAEKRFTWRVNVRLQCFCDLLMCF